MAYQDKYICQFKSTVNEEYIFTIQEKDYASPAINA
jgi:hypothetical protein